MAVDIMIVGAAKSGTSTLLRYLGQHPRLQAQHRREMTWFSDPERHEQPFPDALYFGEEPRNGRLRVGKAAGLMYEADAVARLRALNPAVQAVAILRDPVHRAYSAFWHVRRRGREGLDRFEDAISGADPDGQMAGLRYRYLEGSHYDKYVDLLRDRLGSDAVHVLIFEELLADPQAVLLPLAERLALDPAGFGQVLPADNVARAARSTALAERSGTMARAGRRVVPEGARSTLRGLYRRLNEREWEPPSLDPSTELELRRHFAPSVSSLEAQLGRAIDVWPRL